jgi:hypothetical protein
MKSIHHLLESFKIVWREKSIKLKKPWTVVEVIGCLFPQVARLWIKLTKSPPLKPVVKTDSGRL